ncbi:relaxase domain-containing protein [Streptomyces sp. NPDC051664]|uniref:relaxase domain-containing protein n=1 Tax=Streptomyces sp. NPDC051664 TaxID=3365668 RepID=UPI0037B30B2F
MATQPSERQAELLLGECRDPDADRIECELLTAGESPAAAQRATVLGRPVGDIASPRLALDLVFGTPPTAHAPWARADDATRRVLEGCQEVARDGTLAQVEDSVARVRWGSGGGRQAPVRDGLIVRVFRHCESRSGRPLLHVPAVLSVKVRRPDGAWGNPATPDLSDPREVTPGKGPVMETTGIDPALIAWQSTRRRQIEDDCNGRVQQYRRDHGHEPGERARYKLGRIAADRTRPTEELPRPLTAPGRLRPPECADTPATPPAR